MRYKRVNTLALDVSSTPNEHRVPAVRMFLTFLKLDPAKLRSVQFHSSGKTVFIGLPDDRSASTIAAKTPRFGLGINGEEHYIPVEFVDEDFIEVRVRDLPPETPTELIQQSLRQYGEVLSVIDEVWRDYFPGVPTGVKIARMKVTQNIPIRVTIGNSPAQVNYIGQPSRCKKTHTDANSTTKASVQNPEQQQQQARGINKAAAAEEQRRQQQQHKKKSEKNKTPLTTPGQNPQKEDSRAAESGSPDGFTIVTRGRAKLRQQAEQQQQHQQSTASPSVPAGPTASSWEEALKGPFIALMGELERKANENRSKNKNIPTWPPAP